MSAGCSSVPALRPGGCGSPSDRVPCLVHSLSTAAIASFKCARSVLAAAARSLKIAHHFVQVERGCLLTRRVFDVVLDLLRHDGLHPVKQESVVEDPVPVGVRVLVGPLE